MALPQANSKNAFRDRLADTKAELDRLNAELERERKRCEALLVPLAEQHEAARQAWLAAGAALDAQRAANDATLGKISTQIAAITAELRRPPPAAAIKVRAKRNVCLGVDRYLAAGETADDLTLASARFLLSIGAVEKVEENAA